MISLAGEICIGASTERLAAALSFTQLQVVTQGVMSSVAERLPLPAESTDRLGNDAPADATVVEELPLRLPAPE
jgi:hypothetical protein